MFAMTDMPVRDEGVGVAGGLPDLQVEVGVSGHHVEGGLGQGVDGGEGPEEVVFAVKVGRKTQLVDAAGVQVGDVHRGVALEVDVQALVDVVHGTHGELPVLGVLGTHGRPADQDRVREGLHDGVVSRGPEPPLLRVQHLIVAAIVLADDDHQMHGIHVAVVGHADTVSAGCFRLQGP